MLSWKKSKHDIIISRVTTKCITGSKRDHGVYTTREKNIKKTKTIPLKRGQ